MSFPLRAPPTPPSPRQHSGSVARETARSLHQVVPGEVGPRRPKQAAGRRRGGRQRFHSIRPSGTGLRGEFVTFGGNAQYQFACPGHQSMRVSRRPLGADIPVKGLVSVTSHISELCSSNARSRRGIFRSFKVRCPGFDLWLSVHRIQLLCPRSPVLVPKGPIPTSRIRRQVGLCPAFWRPVRCVCVCVCVCCLCVCGRVGSLFLSSIVCIGAS